MTTKSLHLTLFLSLATATAQTIPSDAKTTCTVPNATFNSWFETGTPTLNGVVKPANSVTFPDVPNCSFHQWTMQMFLWLTSPAPVTYGGGGGRIFSSPVFFDVTPPDANGDRKFLPNSAGGIHNFTLRAAQVGPNKLPIIFDKSNRMFEVQNSDRKPSIRNTAGALIEVSNARREPGGKLVLLDNTGKTIAPRSAPKNLLVQTLSVQKIIIDRIPIFIDPNGHVIDVEQGQADGGVLLAQNGSLVYYLTTVNDVFAYFLTGVKTNQITPGTKFPTTQADLNKIVTFAATKGKTFPDANALAVEIKSAWVEAAGLANLGSYITMQATIPTYDKSNPNKWVPNGKKTVQMAMVGMHVVGSTKGHPEMIWGTFEHFGNAPNGTYQYTNTANQVKTVNQTTAGAWTFAKNNAAAPFNEMHMFANGANIESISPHTISASNTIRWKAWGSAANAGGSTSKNTEVIAINNSVSTQMPAGDVRKNYFMMGSTWTIGGAAPTNNNQVGTAQLANTTMETYQQGTNNQQAGSSNCFSCHTNNTTAVSHIFSALKPILCTESALHP